MHEEGEGRSWELVHDRQQKTTEYWVLTLVSISSFPWLFFYWTWFFSFFFCSCHGGCWCGEIYKKSRNWYVFFAACVQTILKSGWSLHAFFALLVLLLLLLVMEVVGVEKLQEVSKLVCFLCCLRANNIGIWMKSKCFFCFACTTSSSSRHGGCWCGEIFASLEFGMFLCLCANIQIWRRLVISCFACASFSSRHGGCWCGEIAGVDLV